MEFLVEILGQIFLDSIPSSFKYIGAVVKWIFYLGKRNFNVIKKEKGNKRIGFITFLIIVYLIIRIAFYKTY